MTRVIAYERGMETFGRAVVSIGVFDGVHLGHQALIRDAVSLARKRETLAAVVTFDRDPDRVVDPAHAAPQLLELPDKLDLLATLCPDVVLVIPFDAEVAAMPPDAFLDELLLPVFSPVAVVVGHDFRFGARAAGDLATLATYGERHGFEVVGHPLVRVDGEPVTSTRVRALVSAGAVADAARLLGRPHLVRGAVEEGRHVGKALGAPTANVRHAAYSAVPADGVYAATARVGDATYAAAVSVGPPITFADAPATLEAHLLDFRGDLYGAEIVLGFLERLRPLARFESASDLAAAIAADVERVRAVTARAR
ncbi:MAG TPA: riboflavin biosynthesis protein RibF [Coriobacteriia bacterium]|jgi:riboflavin kinase/FMN adenylyltransferase